MLRLESDLVDLCRAAAEGRLAGHAIEWDPRVALGVVMASGGYPERYRTGDPISGLDGPDEATKVFHAGTALGDGGQVLSAGGRVLCVTALGESVAAAQAAAYARASRIGWRDSFHRTDIGYRAIARERA